MKARTTPSLLTIMAFWFCMVSVYGQEFPFQDAELSMEERVDDLVSRLTLEEKIAQMQNNAPEISRLGEPAYEWWKECLHGVARAGVATVFPPAIAMAATWDPDLIREEAEIISAEARARYHEADRKLMEAGESQTVEIPMVIEAPGYYDDEAGGLVLEPGTFEIQVGASSSDIRLKTEIEVH